MISEFGSALGLSPSVVVFLLCFLSSLPLSYVHRLMPTAGIRHIYAFTTGALLCWLSYGPKGNFHLYVPVAFAYIAMRATRKYCGYVVFIFSFAFLTYCHVANLSGDAWRNGGIDFTGTLMVITLKLISCALDYQDGLLPLKQENKRTNSNRLERMPELLEFLGYLFCCGAVLVGPVFELKVYQAFTTRTGLWNEKETPMPSTVPPALRTLAKALVCVTVYQALNASFPFSVLLVPTFQHRNLVVRWALICLVTFTYRWMFYFIWSVAEAACILSGLGFTGWSSSHPPLATWERAKNVDILKVELGASAAQLPGAWNISVARWLRTYVYERLTPPMGKPNFFTLLATQLVSAFWHGQYPGYYLFFVNCSFAQGSSKALYKRHMAIPKGDKWRRLVSTCIQYCFAHSILSYSQLGFCLLRFDDTIRVWKSVYFFGTLLPFFVLFILSFLPRQKEPQKAA